MALHDFWCQSCGRLFADVNVPIAIGATRGAPVCPDCQRQTAWIPQIGAMDAKEPFQEFEVYDGRNRRVLIDSLRRLRQVERESEKLAADGVGQPMVFRRWAQDDSNRDVPTLGAYGGERPDPAKVKQFKPAAATEDAAIDTKFGPGVNLSNASALGGL